MRFATPHDALREQATRMARSGEWSDLAALFAGDGGDGAEALPSLVVLRAESFMHTGQPREARDWLLHRLPELARERESLRVCTNMLGVAQFTLGALDDARLTFERALELGHQDDDVLTVARATNNLGAIANVRGARDEALAHYQLAIPAYQRLGNVVGLAQSYHNMAISFRDIGQLDRADDCERRAIEFARQSAGTSLVLLAQLGRAEISLRAGDATVAEVRAREAARGFAALGDAINQADALRVVGSALSGQGRCSAAADALDAALALARACDSVLHEAEALRARAELHAIEEEYPAAAARARCALGVFARLGATAEVESLTRWIEMLPVVPADERRSSLETM